MLPRTVARDQLFVSRFHRHKKSGRPLLLSQTGCRQGGVQECCFLHRAAFRPNRVSRHSRPHYGRTRHRLSIAGSSYTPPIVENRLRQHGCSGREFFASLLFQIRLTPVRARQAIRGRPPIPLLPESRCRRRTPWIPEPRLRFQSPAAGLSRAPRHCRRSSWGRNRPATRSRKRYRQAHIHPVLY